MCNISIKVSSIYEYFFNVKYFIFFSLHHIYHIQILYDLIYRGGYLYNVIHPVQNLKPDLFLFVYLANEFAMS